MREIKFNLCPRCNSDDLEYNDYEDENGEELTDGRSCNQCRWEGSLDELVCSHD